MESTSEEFTTEGENWIPDGYATVISPDQKRYVVPEFFIPALHQIFDGYHKKVELEVFKAEGNVSETFLLSRSAAHTAQQQSVHRPCVCQPSAFYLNADNITAEHTIYCSGCMPTIGHLAKVIIADKFVLKINIPLLTFIISLQVQASIEPGFAVIGEGQIMAPTIPVSRLSFFLITPFGSVNVQEISDRERLSAHAEILALQERLGILYKDA